MKKWIAAQVTLILIVGLSLTEDAISQSGNDVSPTEVAPPVAGPNLPATGVRLQSNNPRATDPQIKRLVAIQLSPARNLLGTPSAESVSACVDHYLIEVAPGDRSWGPTDSRWDIVRAVIMQDCSVQADAYSAKVAPVLRKTYSETLRQNYESHLSSMDADALIRFYDSEIGNRYLAFQKELTAVAGLGMSQLFRGKLAPDSRTSASEVMTARIRLLRLARTFSMLIVANEDAHRTGGDASGAPPIMIMMRVAAENQGEALDRIRRKYSADLRDFTDFTESQPEADELRALYEATNAAGAAAVPVAAEINPEMNGNLNKWRELYRSLPHR